MQIINDFVRRVLKRVFIDATFETEEGLSSVTVSNEHTYIQYELIHY